MHKFEKGLSTKKLQRVSNINLIPVKSITQIKGYFMLIQLLLSI